MAPSQGIKAGSSGREWTAAQARGWVLLSLSGLPYVDRQGTVHCLGFPTQRLIGNGLPLCTQMSLGGGVESHGPFGDQYCTPLHPMYGLESEVGLQPRSPSGQP